MGNNAVNYAPIVGISTFVTYTVFHPTLCPSKDHTRFLERTEKMAKLKTTTTDYDRLMQMAKEYDVNENALFLSTLDAYLTQKMAIDKMKDSMNEDDVTTTKEYIKGRENVYLHPAIKELPRHTDALNKTAALLLEIMKTLGTKVNNKDDLMDFIK